MHRATAGKLLALVAAVLLLTVASMRSATAQQYNPVTTVTVTDKVLQPYTKRMGINVGYYDQFGAAQFMKNLIPNPGFEGAQISSIFLASPGASSTRVRAAQWSVKNIDGLGGPDFWNGGTYEILTGSAKGRSGKIKQVYIIDGDYVFRFADSGARPPAGSIVAIRSPNLPGYFMSNRSTNLTADQSQIRPGSPGKQSLRMQPVSWTGAPFFYVAFDSLARDGDASAGKMRFVEGNWYYSFWVKPEHAGMTVEFSFQRHKGEEFHKEIVALKSGWQKIERRIYVPPGSDSRNSTNALMISVAISRGQGAIWLDDMVLQNADQKNKTAFSDNYVQLLKELRPGILRDWGFQFGSTLDNQLAPPHARLSNGYHPHRLPKDWHYSLHEFLELAQEVGAEPWYVIPPTWTSAEIRNLIAYLSAPAGQHAYANHRAGLGQYQPWTNVFTKIHLEYGNELWGYNGDNQPGQGFAMGGAIGTADAADNRFSIMRGAPWFNPGKFNLIVSGQVNHPDLQGQIERRLGTHNSIGIAPYYGDIKAHGSNEQLFQPLFASAMQDAEPFGRVAQSRASMDRQGGAGTELAVYEINTQIRPTSAPLNVRNDWYSSLGTGLALPLHMLTLQRELGINNQAAFTAAQYSRATGHNQWDQLWGLLRDVEATQRKRPGWLGLEMANSAIRGRMLETVQSGGNPHWTQPPINTITQSMNVPYVQSFAYLGKGNQYSIVLFNLHLYASQSVQLNLPARPFGNATIRVLTAADIKADNESAENVRINTSNRYIDQWEKIELPAHSMVVVQWNQ